MAPIKKIKNYAFICSSRNSSSSVVVVVVVVVAVAVTLPPPSLELPNMDSALD